MNTRLDFTSQPTSGKTYVMFHGTARQNANSIRSQGFLQSKNGALGRGVYLSRDLQNASRYPRDLHESQRVVFRVAVNVGNVIAIKYDGHPQQYTWKDHGYDTAWVPPISGGLEKSCVWDPNRISILGLTLLHKTDFTSQPTSGKTYVMFHGTARQNANSIRSQGFLQSKNGALGCGVYLSRDLQKASRYPSALPQSQRVVFRVAVNVGNVIAIKYDGHPQQYTWKNHGYDTAWVPPISGSLEESCVWDPNRISILGIITPVPKTPSTPYPQ